MFDWAFDSHTVIQVYLCEVQKLRQRFQRTGDRPAVAEQGRGFLLWRQSRYQKTLGSNVHRHSYCQTSTTNIHMHVHHDQTFQLEQRIQPNKSSGNAMAATSVELDQVHQATEAIQRSWSPINCSQLQQSNRASEMKPLLHRAVSRQFDVEYEVSRCVRSFTLG